MVAAPTRRIEGWPARVQYTGLQKTAATTESTKPDRWLRTTRSPEEATASTFQPG